MGEGGDVCFEQVSLGADFGDCALCDIWRAWASEGWWWVSWSGDIKWESSEGGIPGQMEGGGRIRNRTRCG